MPKSSNLLANFRPFWLLALAASLYGCGGGGGGGNGDLAVDFSYPQPYAYLWRASTVQFQGVGLQGNTPSCSIISGTLPIGLSLQSLGCQIVGTPLESKSALVTIRLTVSGYQGQVDKPVQIESIGPAVSYPFIPVSPVGTPVSYSVSSSAPPNIPVWSPQAGESVSYSVTSGALPDGLALDSQNGTVSGILSRNDVFNFTVSATAVGPLGTAVSSAGSRSLIAAQGLLFFYGPNDLPVSKLVGESVTLTPLFNFGMALNPSNYNFSNYRLAASSSSLPAGLTLDPSTGILSGQVQVAGTYQLVIQTTVASGGQTATFPSSVLLLTVSQP